MFASCRVSRLHADYMQVSQWHVLKVWRRATVWKSEADGGDIIW